MQRRMATLSQSDADHAGHHCDLHGNAHTGYRHIAVLRHLAVHEDTGKAHQKIPQCGRNADARTPEETFSFTEKSLRLMLREEEPFRK